MALTENYNAADIQRELDALKNRLDTANQYAQLTPLAAAPLNPKAGWVAISDGTGSGFDGSSGAGMYRYSGSAWVFTG